MAKVPAWRRMLSNVQPLPVRPEGPEKHHVIVGGRLAVSVGIVGKAGRGRRMVLDAADWERVKLVLHCPAGCAIYESRVQLALVGYQRFRGSSRNVVPNSHTGELPCSSYETGWDCVPPPGR